MTVGENIKKYRKAQGLTQEQLGKLCEPKMAESTIRQYELGLRNPKLETLKKIARALGVYIGNLDENWTNYIENKDDLISQDYAIPYTAYVEGLKRFVKHEEELLLNDYHKLNSEGRREACKRVSELTEIPRYTETPED